VPGLNPLVGCEARGVERGWLRRGEIRGFQRCLRDATIFSLWFLGKFHAPRHAYLLTK